MKYSILLLDLDDTILDFHQAEGIALERALRELGIPVTERVRASYSRINRAHWERLERGELTRAQVNVGRFAELFSLLSVQADAAACAARYAQYLAMGHYFLPGAKEALAELARERRLFLVSNGNLSVQRGRLKSADIARYFENIFISEQIGADKPSEVFFARCFAQIPNFSRENAMIVGDSLTSDILGGNRAGICTCWVNPAHLPCSADICADEQIEYLAQLPQLLARREEETPI